MCNLWVLYPADRRAQHAYFVVMTISNVVTMLCMVGWVRVLRGHATTPVRVFGFGLTSALALMRQKECVARLQADVGYFSAMA